MLILYKTVDIIKQEETSIISQMLAVSSNDLFISLLLEIIDESI